MKKFIYLIALLCLTLLVQPVVAQEKKEATTESEKILNEANFKSKWDQKFYWGITWNQYWSTFKGPGLAQQYFAKPSIGFGLTTQYYPLSFVGVSVGAGVQQRGAGVINVDNYGAPFTHPWQTPYDRDSTHRERLRFNTIEVPLTLLLRTPKEVIRGVKLSASAGIIYYHSYSIKNVFLSPEDGYHQITNVESFFDRNDIAYQFALGADINAGESCIFQIQLVYNKGTKNVYAAGQGDGRHQSFGFRVGWLF